MKIAVIADVHGILPALEIALDEISAVGVEGIIVAGDIVAGPDSDKAVRRLRELNCWMIQGNNEDYALTFRYGNPPDWWFTARQWSFIRWTYEHLSQETLEFLKTLPQQRTIQLEGTDAIRVVHGGPGGLSDLIYPDRDITTLDEALRAIEEPVAIFAHTHMDWQMQRQGKLSLNPGSTGMSFRGEHYGTYALLRWENGCWQAEARKIHYDFDLLMQRYVESGLLQAGNYFARCGLASIKSGVNFLPPMMFHAYDKAKEAGQGGPFVPDEIWDRACAEFEDRHFKDLL